MKFKDIGYLDFKYNCQHILRLRALINIFAYLKCGSEKEKMWSGQIMFILHRTPRISEIHRD